MSTKRFSPKVGDLFSVRINDQNKKYFQSIAVDSTQLGSTVIRAFKKAYGLEEDPNPKEIIEDEVEFYAHCSTKLGVKLGLWQKVGSIAEVGQLDQIFFRGTNDYGSKPGEQILVSENWYVWRVNDKEFRKVGKLEGKYRDAEIGVVVNPYEIVNRMKTGKYNFFYPGY